MLYRKRKTEALEGRKLPKLRRGAKPTLKQFSEKFLEAVRTRSAAKPRTIEFYEQQSRYVLNFEQLANRPLDEVDEVLIEQFSQTRRQSVGIASTNRALAVLRRMLRVAHEWRLLDRVPKIRLLSGEQNREFVLSYEQERIYLEFAPELLRHAAILMLDAGLGPPEALSLEWTDVHADYLELRSGKTRYRRRKLSLTARVREMLERRRAAAESKFVFPGKNGSPMRESSLCHLHAQVRRKLKLPNAFVSESPVLTPLSSCVLPGTHRSPPLNAMSIRLQKR